MKKTIISFSLFLAISLSAFSAAVVTNGLNPDQRILEGFKKEFTAAQSVSWEKQGDYEKATFLLTGHRVIAWFNPAGQLQGCVRDIFFDQLPLNVMTAVDKRFAGADILSVREITNSEGTSYSITLETTTKKYTVKVDPSGSIGQVDKQAK